MIKTQAVRNEKQSTVGYQPDVWKSRSKVIRIYVEVLQ